ncbi:MAG: lytic transglycosylase domain-containing protein [Acidiferrobacteraceae bacterium]
MASDLDTSHDGCCNYDTGGPGQSGRTRVPLQWITAFVITCCLSLSSPAFAKPAQSPDPALIALLRKAASQPYGFRDRFSAEVWLADMSNRLKSILPYPRFRIRLLKDVHYEAVRAGLNPDVVLAVIQVESDFNPYAISSAGARGLMQVMPFWLKRIGKPSDNLFHVQTNLRYGCTILKYYLNKAHGNLPHALALYNGSNGRDFYPARVYHALNTRWFNQ